MRTGYALRPVSLYNTVHTDSFTATIIIIMMIVIMIITIMIIIVIIIYNNMLSDECEVQGHFENMIMITP